MKESHLSYMKTVACFCIDSVTVLKLAVQCKNRNWKPSFEKSYKKEKSHHIAIKTAVERKSASSNRQCILKKLKWTDKSY